MKIHFVGISGVSMQALASFAASRGHTVTGSDNSISGHDPKNVDGADLVVYTCAVPPDNCELVRAKELKIPTVERAVYLGEIAATYGKVIAIAGCQGKSTTTAMTGAALSPHLPTVHVGVSGGSVVGSDRFFVTEACEYKSNFLHLTPDVGVILNVGYDHPDYYHTEEQLINAYKRFAAKCKTVIVNGDDEATMSLCKDPVTFGTGEKCDYRAVDIKNENGYRSFKLAGRKQAFVRLAVPGAHNVYNALATIAAADVCGIRLAEILPNIAKFSGIPRRFERKGVAFGKSVFTDYAHHPAEIAATIKTAKEIFPSVAVVFQPHTFTRTKSLMDEFAESLSAADTVILAPIFSARENPIEGITSHALCRKIVEQKEKAYCFDTFAEIVEHTKSVREAAVIFMGAGDINCAADLFIKADKDLPTK